MRSRLLLRAGLRFFLRKPWQSGLAVLGVATGVAAVAGIALASASAERAFALSVESIAGPATHEIVGGPSGIDETWYATLERSPRLPRLIPIVEGWIQLEELERPVRLLGLDLFAGAGVSRGPATEVDASALLLRPGAALVGARLRAELAARAKNHALGWTEDEREEKVGDRVNLAMPAGLDALWLIGTLEASNRRQEEAMGRLVVVDISTAQELLGRLGRLDRVEVIFDPANSRDSGATLERLRALLPPQAVLQAKSARAGALEEMTYAFRLNLRALSMLALLVGAFLIYSTVSFAVVQRRQLIGLVRALGTSRRQVAALVLTEALVIGTLGTILGLAAGTLLARGLLVLMVQTINDLYFALEVERVTWLGTPLLLSAALGLVTSLLIWNDRLSRH